MGKFNSQWASQTNLGKKFGLSAIAVGKLLSDNGLKNGKSATEFAISEGYAKLTPLKDGIEFYMWSVHKCQQIIQRTHKQLDKDELSKQKFADEVKEFADIIWTLRFDNNSCNDKLEDIMTQEASQKVLDAAQIILDEKYKKFRVKRLAELQLNPDWIEQEKQHVINSRWEKQWRCPSVSIGGSAKCPICGIFDGFWHNYHDITAVILGQKPCCNSDKKQAESEILAAEARRIGLAVAEEDDWYIIGRHNRVNRLLKSRFVEDDAKRHTLVGLILGYEKSEVLDFVNKIK